MRKNATLKAAAVAAIAVAILGLAGRNPQHPFGYISRIKNRLLPNISILPKTGVLKGKTLVRRNVITQHRNITALVFGQSNSANHGLGLYKPRFPVYNFFRGKIYKAEDPLLGATGHGGSVWSRLGDMLIENRICDNVLLVPCGVSGSSIRDWVPGGEYYPRLQSTMEHFNKAGLRLTHVFWHQGETDNGGISGEEYKRLFLEIKNRLYSHGPRPQVFICVATWTRQMGTDGLLQQAQRELAREHPDIFLGPNTDLLISESDRYDGAHFSASGLDRFASAWIAALKKVALPEQDAPSGLP